MRLAIYHEHPPPHDGYCRIRIYEPEIPGDHHVVILTELPDNLGQSVTNCVEQLAGETVTEHASPFSAKVVIEHYEEAERADNTETYALVTFSCHAPGPELRCGVWTLELGVPT